MAVLIDSNVWISAINSKKREYHLLNSLIRNNELIYVTKLIQFEVTRGAKSSDLLYKYWGSFLGFVFLDINEDIWWGATLNYAKCRKHGITPSNFDILIATTSSHYNVPLWSMDKIFIKIAPILGLELYKPYQ